MIHVAYLRVVSARRTLCQVTGRMRGIAPHLLQASIPAAGKSKVACQAETPVNADLGIASRDGLLRSERSAAFVGSTEGDVTSGETPGKFIVTVWWGKPISTHPPTPQFPFYKG